MSPTLPTIPACQSLVASSNTNYASGTFVFPLTNDTRGGRVISNTSNVLFISPAFIPKVTISSVFYWIIAAGDAGSLIRPGIYKDNGYGMPGNLFYDFGTGPGDNVGNNSIAVAGNLTIPAGLYWLGAAIQNFAVTAPEAVCVLPNWPNGVMVPRIDPQTAGPINGLDNVNVPGALPNPFNITAFHNSGATPDIGFTVA